MSKTCVIVSPYFPPSTLAGVHRARHLAKHLPAAGWKPIVLCVHEAYHEERPDPGLANLVPAATEIIKVPALSPLLTRLVGVGDISLRSFFSLRSTLLGLLATRHVDAVLITGSPYYPMLLSNEVKRRFGVPVVLDFQDPWVSAWGAAQPLLSKAGMSHSLATLLEPRALRGADFVTSVSEIQNEQMAARLDWLDRKRMAAIPIGFDPEDFEAAGGELQDRSGPTTTLCYVGTCMPRSVPVFEVFFRALARLRDLLPDLARRLRIDFIGTSNQPNEFDKQLVTPLAGAAGVAELINEVPQRVPYLEALSILRRSDGILLIGSDEPHYSASKIYPALFSGRPFLSVFHRSSGAHDILSSAGGGVALSFSSADELNALAGAICDGLHKMISDPGSLGTSDPAVYRPFEARAIARRYADILGQLPQRHVGQ